MLRASSSKGRTMIALHSQSGCPPLTKPSTHRDIIDVGNEFADIFDSSHTSNISILVPHQMSAPHDARALCVASAFVRKLYRILDNEDPRIIAWDVSGLSFTIHDPSRLEKEVLPRYFRGRFEAFRQQLIDHDFDWAASNLSFDRLVGNRTSEATSALPGAESFQHDSFVRGRPEMLGEIIRKPGPKKRRSTLSAATRREVPLLVIPQALQTSDPVSSSAEPSSDVRDGAAASKRAHIQVARWLGAAEHTVTRSSATPIASPNPSYEKPTTKVPMSALAQVILWPWSIMDDRSDSVAMNKTGSFRFASVETADVSEEVADSMLQWCDKAGKASESA